MADVSGAPFAPYNVGTAAPSKYGLGRGAFYFAELTAADVPDADGWIYVGNSRRGVLNTNRDYLEHFSSITGVRNLDARIPITEGFSVGFTPEELNEKNAEMYLSGESAALTNAAIAGFTQYEMISAVELGRYYPVVNSSGVQAFGFAAGDLALEENGGAGTPLVAGTDYTVLSAEGMILIHSDATNVADGEAIDATLTADATLNTMRRMSIMAREEFNVSLKFIGESPRNGRKYELWIPKASISADGGMDIITEQDLIGLPLMATALKVSGYELGYLTALPPAA